MKKNLPLLLMAGGAVTTLIGTDFGSYYFGKAIGEIESFEHISNAQVLERAYSEAKINNELGLTYSLSGGGLGVLLFGAGFISYIRRKD